jgi:S1-C subfamily serine protease
MSELGDDAARALKIEPGVLVNAVPEDTPASRMGLKAGDVIVSVSGQAVRRIEDIRRLATMNPDNHAVTLQIMRERKSRSITVR